MVCQVIMERMALSGFVHAMLADVIVAALCGAGVLAATAGAFLPLLGYGLAGGCWPWSSTGSTACPLPSSSLPLFFRPSLHCSTYMAVDLRI